ncbi:uncharacterized protein BJ212DRAFT_104216 [Suillus subaureus]|uniref:Uncharacterized protein n=1 Tax=Suillus subaureus TaxID=48587 RepID=A0A9P7EDH2_9AGAM|nr:uncharacterized protein BJ212DRAFT_104216 [Suillus subaureus]KAG1818697.1 hypothetical protein BJ212DRAFT_104216 [Suillus subaureus]
MGNSVTSLVWSSDSTKLYSASDEFPRVFNSETGELLHRFEHDHIDASDEFARVFSSNNASDVRAFNSRCTSDEHRTPRLGHSFDRFRTARFGDPPPSGHSFAIYSYDRPKVYHHNILNSVALSPTHDILACVGANGVAQFWDTVSHQQLGQPLHKNHKFTLRCVSFSRDGRYVAYGGYDKKLTLRMLKDIAPQLLPNRRQSTQQVTRPNSPLSSCLDADATGGGGFIEEARDDPYYHFFQQPPPSPSPGFRLPLLFSTRRLWNVISRRCPPPDESVPQECSKRGFFSRRARSNLSQEVATIKPDQQVLESKREEGDGEQRETCGFTHDSPSARKDEGKQRDDPPDNAQSPPSADRTPPAQPDSKDSRCLRERLIHAQGKYLAFGFLRSSTPSANAPKQILRNHRYWNSSSYPLGSSRYTVDVAACRDEDRYGIAPETDEEAAAAMLRTNNDVADSSTRPGQPVVVAQVSQGQLTQTQASTSGPGEIVYEGVSCCGFFCGYVRRSNPRQS